MAKTTDNVKSLTDVLATARALLAEQQQEVERLAEQANLNSIRGTRDIPRKVAPLADRLAALLTVEAQDARSAATALGVPVGRVKPIMDGLRDGARIHNIGSEVEPLWQHVLGDDCAPADLHALVLRLIRMRPFTHHELVIVTGARDNRISGVLADLRENPQMRVTNLGNGSRGRWFLLPDDVQLAPLRRANGKR